MDGYPSASVAHNVPLLVVSGLGSFPEGGVGEDEDGFRITSELPSVDTEDSRTLLRYFKKSDAEGLAWTGREHIGRNRFKIKNVGRDYILPLRSARIHAPSARPPESHRDANPIPRPVAHSPLSPLTPEAPIYPDGLIDYRWVEKHQDTVPSAFLAVYNFTSDPTVSTLQDNQLKNDINAIKSTLIRSGYKTRLVAVLLSEGSVIKTPDVEDRLANIRKATGLDSKTSLYFLPPQSSTVEIEAFVETITATIYPLCIEYYRDLSKHSRRKRNRGIVPQPSSPPTSGTSQTLSSQGWNVRYDFKLGVFAEFRQEMDAAIRSYESGYEGLLGPDVIETIASWSSRWTEARLLADVFAIRILRCLLWNGSTTAAVRRWQTHRDIMRDFVDRRGKGSSTYGWEAWEARWATAMAELIKKAVLSDFGIQGTSLFLQPEKTIAVGERLEPWEHMHHPGYWYRLASHHLTIRRTLALAIPEEDRLPPAPGSTPLTSNKTNTYDTYLCPEPYEENPIDSRGGVDHSQLIITSLTKAIAEFEKRKQNRLVHELCIISAKESMRREEWDTALRIFRPLWQKMSFRKEGWWSAVEEICWALREAAAHAGDAVTVLSVDWELLNRTFIHHPNWHYDFEKSLEDVKNIKGKPVVVLHNQDIHSFLSATYVFQQVDGKVGEPCSSQLVVISSAHAASSPVAMTEINIAFEGSMKPIVLRHKPSTSDNYKNAFRHSRVTLAETHPEDKDELSVASTADVESRCNLMGEDDLSFYPGQTRVFEFISLLREAGEAKAISATFSKSSEAFDLDFVQTFEPLEGSGIWTGAKGAKRRIVRENVSAITILPKPPKLEIQLIGLQQQNYTNEFITLQLEIVNGEDIDSIASLDVRLLGEGVSQPTLKLATPFDEESHRFEEGAPAGFAIGKIASSASCFVEVNIPPLDLPAVYDLTVRASYHLASDMETSIYKTIATQLVVINPFEANYDFSPRIHPDPWPSIFTHGEGEDAEDGSKAHGLLQKWCLTSRYFSFAAEDLIVEDLDIEIIGTNGSIQCSSKKATQIPQGGIRVSPKSLDEVEFDIYTQKLSLDDRGTATLDVSLAIKWRRDTEASPLNTTVVAVPRLLVSSSEPRVLAAVSYSATIPSMIHFDVTIENPSNHFLTFGLSMEPSEKFAFSGTKAANLQLVPLSRRTVRFRLLPFVRGEWIGPIRCAIRDRYFQKILKIAITEGMKVDKEGILVWVPPDDEVEDDA